MFKFNVQCLCRKVNLLQICSRVHQPNQNARFTKQGKFEQENNPIHVPMGEDMCNDNVHIKEHLISTITKSSAN